jgi:hypothetical protein
MAGAHYTCARPDCIEHTVKLGKAHSVHVYLAVSCSDVDLLDRYIGIFSLQSTYVLGFQSHTLRGRIC